MINFVEPYKLHDEYWMKWSLNLDKLRLNLPHQWMVTTIVRLGVHKTEERPSRIRVLSVWRYARSCAMCAHQGLNSCWPDVPGLGANVVFVDCTRCPTSFEVLHVIYGLHGLPGHSQNLLCSCHFDFHRWRHRLCYGKMYPAGICSLFKKDGSSFNMRLSLPIMQLRISIINYGYP